MTFLHNIKAKGLLALLAVFCAGSSQPWSVALATPAPALQDYCWTVKTTICTDCAESDSKYCDPRTSEGPFFSCIQSLTKPCPGFSCSSAEASIGPPCSG